MLDRPIDPRALLLHLETHRSLAADGIFHGQGIRSLAIAGALKVFEQHRPNPIAEWHNVGGTSAGALIAAYLADRRPVARLADWIDDMPRPYYGPRGPVVGGLGNLVRRHGAQRTDRLARWLDDEFGDLEFGALRTGEPTPAAPNYRLQVVAADITARRPLVLPDDFVSYVWPGQTKPISPDKLKVADAVRMSMSIPGLVEPVTLTDVRTGRPATIVDGGVASSFPVWLFDTHDREAERPTFGFRLASAGSRVASALVRRWWPASMALDVVATRASAWERHTVATRPELRTVTIDPGAASSLAFNLSESARATLVAHGRRAAREFLNTFDADAYRNRSGMPLADTSRWRTGERS